jgi:hypothetical protein
MNSKRLSIIKRFFIKLIILIPGKFKLKQDSSIEPVWIIGMFRSGTSFLCQLLNDSGVSFGRKSFLLQPMGQLKDLNPKGFFEDFIFAEISRYLLFKMKRSGDNPPTDEESLRASLNSIDINEMIKMSFFKIREDRISFKNKIFAFMFLKIFGLNYYLKRLFENPLAVKIPLLSFFHSELIKYWPRSKFIVIFRHPSSVIESAKRLTNSSDSNLFIRYNSGLIRLANCYTPEQVLYISYDDLIYQPEKPLTVLAKFLGLDYNIIREVFSKNFDPSLLRNKPTDINNSEVLLLYNKLQTLTL